MSGITWAKTEQDDRNLAAGNMYDGFLKIKTEFEERHGKPLKAVKLSRITLLSLPLLHSQDPYSITRFYGVPVEIDNSLDLWEFKEVYA